MPAQATAITSGQLEWEDREWFPPGPQLAICLSGGKERLASLTDDELLQVAKAARRQTSWAQARELAAIAELTRRHTTAEDASDPDYRILSARESVTEEVAAALTVTGNTAATLVHLAEQLTGPLTRTGDALGAGHIDLAKARVICDITDHLPEQATQRVEGAALEKAPQQTTGQLRRRIKRIAQRLAPQAIEERKQEAVQQRRLELWDTPSGTTDLALCDLRPEDAHAIYNKITAAAHGIKTDGDTRPLKTIRADLATQLLHGTELPTAVRTLLTQTDPDTRPTPPSDNLPPAPASTHGGHCSTEAIPDHTSQPPSLDTTHTKRANVRPLHGDAHPRPARTGPVGGGDLIRDSAARDSSEVGPSAPEGGGVRCLDGDAQLKLAKPEPVRSGDSACKPHDVRPSSAKGGSVRSLDGGAQQEPARIGLVGSGDPARELSDVRPSGRAGLVGDVDVSVLADVIGQRLAHVSGRVTARELPAAIRRAVQRIHREFADARDAVCRGDDQAHGRPGYRPPAALRREIEARHATCVFPTCNQPAHRCDLDHTVPWRPGTTCRCNLAPLCRRHHRTKQSPGWRLHQIWPGLLIWITPSGAWYIVRPDRQ